MSSLRGKVIAVTGAASGIGRAVAMQLAERGALLSIADVNKELLATTSAELTELHKKHAGTDGGAPEPVLSTVVDVRKYDEVEAWTRATVAHFGQPLYGAANVAGVAGGFHMTDKGFVRSMPDDGWDLVMDINAKGVFNCVRAQLNALQQGAKGRGGGSIVNASSVAGVVGVNRGGAYTASKHAVVGLTKSAAKEEGARGIRVNCVAPGMVDTPMVAAARKQTGGAEWDSRPVPGALGRMADPSEIASVFTFLLSEEASFVTGATISVDGGWNC